MFARGIALITLCVFHDVQENSFTLIISSEAEYSKVVIITMLFKYSNDGLLISYSQLI